MRILIQAVATVMVGMVLSILITPVFSRLGARFGLLDAPGGRKRHARSTPLVGGLSIAYAAGLALAISAAWGWHRDGISGWFVVAASFILVLGVGDDLLVLPYWLRGLVEIGLALLLVLLTHTSVDTLGAMLDAGPIVLGGFAVPFTVLCLVGFMNAMNMTDGVDGLAGGTAFIAQMLLAVLAGLGSVKLCIHEA